MAIGCEKARRQNTLIFLRFFKVLGAPRGSQSRKVEEAPNGIEGQEFSAGSAGSRQNGVRSCGSDPAFHAQGS